MITKYPPDDGVAQGLPARGLAERLGAIASWLADWVDTRADHRAAAEMRRQLAALSDAELARRGLSRATLASGVPAATHADPRLTGGEGHQCELMQEGLGQGVPDVSGRRYGRSVS